VTLQGGAPISEAVEEALTACAAHGFARLRWPRDVPLGELASAARMRVVDHRLLRAREREHARPGTLSARFGREAFPWHTDGAHLGLPPRISLMRALEPSVTPTLVLDLQLHLESADDLRRGLRRGVWTVHGGGRPFHAPAISSHGQIRFNAAIMTPRTFEAMEAHAALESLLAAASGTPCTWSDADHVLVIDNARMLHARPPVEDEARRLERTLCESPHGLGL